MFLYQWCAAIFASGVLTQWLLGVFRSARILPHGYTPNCWVSDRIKKFFLISSISAQHDLSALLCKVTVRHTALRNLLQDVVLSRVEHVTTYSDHVMCERVTWETAVPRCSVKKLSWKISENSQINGHLWRIFLLIKVQVCSLFVEHFRATVLVTVLFPYTCKFELHLYQSMTQTRQIRILPNPRTYTFVNSHTFSYTHIVKLNL